METEQQQRINEVLACPDIQKAFNHVAVMNKELGETRDEIKGLRGDFIDLKTNMATQVERLNWICQTYWIIASASIGSLLIAIFQLLAK
jgi:hypothetical protein